MGGVDVHPPARHRANSPTASWQITSGIVGVAFSTFVAITGWTVSADHVPTWFRVVVLLVTLGGVAVYGLRTISGVRRLRQTGGEEGDGKD
jgi:hypothetical protein